MREILDVLTQNGGHAGGPLGVRDGAKLLGRHAGKWHTGAF
jgi:hypothetical protein